MFLRCFHSTCFYSSPGFHISSFAVFQVWLLTYYFYFSNKADKFCFLLESLFSLCYLSKIVKNFGFMRNKICHDIKNSFIKPAGIYLLKVSNGNTRARCDICSKLTIKTLERLQWRRSGVFIVNFEHISHLVLIFLLLTLRR